MGHLWIHFAKKIILNTSMFRLKRLFCVWFKTDLHFFKKAIAVEVILQAQIHKCVCVVVVVNGTV